MAARCGPTGRGVLLLGLGLSILLPRAGCGPQPSWGYAAYEIVVPSKLGPKAGKAGPDEVSYSLSIEGVNYTICLRQKDFVIKKIPCLHS